MNGDWTQWRHDAQRTGRASVAGKITRPEVAWRHFVGCREDWVVLKAEAGDGSLVLPAEESGGMESDFEALERQYALGRYIDVDGSGKSVKVTESPRSRFHRLLPGVKGVQQVTFQSAFQVGKQDNYGWLESFEDGLDHPRRVWETERDHTYFMPLIVFSDVDGDGREEIVMTAHYRIFVFDPDTGKKRQELRYHDVRNYGDLHAVDLDGDGRDEFVQIVTFQAHMEVIDNDGGQLKVAWFKEINEGIISRLTKVTMPPYRPFGDIDGDGKPEVVCTFFDLEGDGKWHVFGFEAMTGERKLDLPDTALTSLEDVDGDGVSELFCVDAPHPHWPETSGARLMSCKGGQARTVWERPDAGWLVWRPPVDPPKSAYGSARGAWRVLFEDVDGDGQKEFFTFEEGDAPTVRAWRMRDGQAVETLRFSGVEPEVLNVCDADGDGRPEVLFRLRRPDDRAVTVMTDRCRATVVASRRTGGHGAPPLVIGSSGSPVIVTQQGEDEVVALGVSPGERQPHVLWRRPGCGMETVEGNQGLGLASIDAEGEGVRRVLLAATGPGRCARMEAVGLDGQVAWHHDFPAFRHRPLTWNCNGMVNWNAGRFLGRRGEDVVVSLRRNTMHSDECHALRGDTGEEVWRQDGSVTVGNETRGFGGKLFAVVDRGKGDDLVSGYPDIYYVADGRTGEVVAERILARGTFPIVPKGEKREADWWVAYQVPVVTDLNGDASAEALLAGGGYLTSALRLEGEPIWHGDYATSGRPMQGIGDVDGDGRLEVGSCEPDRGFVCFDGATGEVRWTWADLQVQPSAITSIVTCDVDGDGLEEFLLPSEKELIAFNGRDGKANVVWRMPLPATCRQVVVSDADGDGRAEILMPCADGYLYCVR